MACWTPSARKPAPDPAVCIGPAMSGEANFIAAMRAIAIDPVARGLNDDAAVLTFGGEALVLTHDMMAEGVHWLPDQDAADVACKLVATNLSDLAAKGARPLGVLLGFALGDREWDQRFAVGLHDALTQYDVALWGGDTVGTQSGDRVLGMTAIGHATHQPVPARDGAKIGDGVYLVGKIGAAMMGFEAIRDGTNHDSAAFRRPRALIEEGVALAPHVTAMMDVSDGLLLDAARMATASGVAFDLSTDAIAFICPEDRRNDALRWGDDYALLCTAPATARLPEFATRIGTVRTESDTPISLDGRCVEADDRLGFQHE